MRQQELVLWQHRIHTLHGMRNSALGPGISSNDHTSVGKAGGIGRHQQH